jgi:hypothetical protein
MVSLKCEYVDVDLLGWSSGLKMEEECFSETLASTDKSTRRYNPEDQHRHLHRRENLRSHMIGQVSFH